MGHSTGIVLMAVCAALLGTFVGQTFRGGVEQQMHHQQACTNETYINIMCQQRRYIETQHQKFLEMAQLQHQQQQTAKQQTAKQQQQQQQQRHQLTSNHVPLSYLGPKSTWNYVDSLPPGGTRGMQSGILTQSECDALVEILQYGPVKQESVGDDLSGVPLRDVWQYGFGGSVDAKGNVTKEQLDILMQLRLRVRDAVKNYFGIPAVYPEYTHLTQRGRGSNFVDYSHGPHCDQCGFDFRTGSCLVAEKHCCVWRHYSALTYLAPSDGGDFFFMDFEAMNQTGYGSVPLPTLGNVTVTFVKPACGRVVFFSSGPENIHGVTKVENGIRRAAAMWLTVDENRAEAPILPK